mmetsp:Transcript_11820/g.49659  ORF Transcript_11820/g.49659 Transcript_11820/m.49659 type:complete len:172 (-) Transcript_11820:36-551(-)
MRAAGEAGFKEASAEREASAKLGASPAAATAAKEQPPREPHPRVSMDVSRMFPKMRFQNAAGTLVASTRVVDWADESRARRDGTAPTPPAGSHDPDAKYPGEVPNEGTVQTAGPSSGHGFNAAEANATAAQLQANAMAAQLHNMMSPFWESVMREVGEEEKASEEPAGAAR